MPLEALRARERGRRLLLFGLIGMLYAGGWLFLSWRATRVGRAECEVVRVNSDYCTVRHLVDGKEHTLAWDDCFEPTRWPKPVPGPAVVGARMSCYYYRSDPSSIFFEPRDERWLGPTPAVALLAAEETREIGFMGVIALFSHGLAIAIAVVVFRRSSVTIDPARRLLVREWGLATPFFFDYRSLDEVRVSIAPGYLGRARLVVLDLGHGEQDVYPLTDAAEQAARAIEGLLAPESTLEP